MPSPWFAKAPCLLFQTPRHRFAWVVEKRQEGLTYDKIAKMLGVGKVRARQLYEAGGRMLRHEAPKPEHRGFE